jgi:hypothetical protein
VKKYSFVLQRLFDVETKRKKETDASDATVTQKMKKENLINLLFGDTFLKLN